MNEPLNHRGYKLYQSSFRPMEDDEGNETGQYMSIFQIGYDPGRWLKYGGCILVVFGTFVQFYMRAGVFSDGGKLKRARAEQKQAKKAGARPRAAVPLSTRDPALSTFPSDRGGGRCT